MTINCFIIATTKTAGQADESSMHHGVECNLAANRCRTSGSGSSNMKRQYGKPRYADKINKKTPPPSFASTAYAFDNTLYSMRVEPMLQVSSESSCSPMVANILFSRVAWCASRTRNLQAVSLLMQAATACCIQTSDAATK